MKAALLGLVLVLALAGCSVMDRARHEAALKQQQAADQAICTGHGFKQGTPEFANCLDQQRKRL
jgi:hypothetical protein